MKLLKKPFFILIIVFLVTTATFAQDFTEPVPLPELCGNTYLEMEGCLYPNSNNMLISYQNEVNLAINYINSLQNIDFLCSGMSNLAQTCASMIEKSVNAGVNPKVSIHNGGRPGRAIQAYDGASPGEVYFNFKYTNVNPNNVDVVVFFNAWSNPSGNLDDYLEQMRQSIREVYDNLQDAYPNAQLIYFTSREYAPEWASLLNPNPYAYWDGFAYKTIIEERINGELSGIPIVWGAYQYDETWPNSYFRVPDGVHLSSEGLDFAGQLWLDYFMTQSWFNGDVIPTATPNPVLSVTPTMLPTTPTLTPIPSNTPEPTATMPGNPTSTPDGCPPWKPDCWATKPPRVTNTPGGWGN